MTPPRAVRIHTTTGILAAITLLVQCTTATAAGWSLDKVYGERMAMRVADQRCQLFAGSISSALFMGEVQARNTALRSGMDADRLAEIADIAVQRGSTVACRDPALLTEAAHVRSAFSSYSRIQRMDFPGAAAGWKADRTVLSTRVEDGRWALTTTPVRAGSNQRFGIVVQAGRLSLFAEPGPGPGPEPGQMQPSAARLVMRDAQRTARPYLAGNLSPPPRASSTVFFAEARRSAPGGGTGFRFSDAAVAALVQLDPREAVQLEFVYPTPQGERVVTGIYEVGDFAPAYGFLTVSH